MHFLNMPSVSSSYFLIIARFIARNQLSPADSLCKQIEPRLRPTEYQASSGSKLFDTLIVALCDLFVKTCFLTKSVDKNKSMNNYPA